MRNFSTVQGCVCCGLNAPGTTCLHHLYTRKARPDLQFETFNLIPACVFHHNEFHSIGTAAMAVKYPDVRNWLFDNKWEFDVWLGKWRHPEANKN